jgi:hypothetical protein
LHFLAPLGLIPFAQIRDYQAQVDERAAARQRAAELMQQPIKLQDPDHLLGATYVREDLQALLEEDMEELMEEVLARLYDVAIIRFL